MAEIVFPMFPGDSIFKGEKKQQYINLSFNKYEADDINW